MPEGHTIHGIARKHRTLFVGFPLRAGSPQGRFADGAAAIDGRQLQSVDAYGKHLFYLFDGDRILHVHLGLIGRFRTYEDEAPEPTGTTRLVLERDAAAAHLTGPMTCRIADPPVAEETIAGLGPDPLRSRRSLADFAARMSRSRAPVGAALLDQSIVAGIGNVYRAEVLFLCGLHPATPARDLSSNEVACLWEKIADQLRLGLRMGRIVTVSPVDVGATRRSQLDEDHRRYVYHRDGSPCHRCGAEIRVMEAGGRKVWWCPGCQPH